MTNPKDANAGRPKKDADLSSDLGSFEDDEFLVEDETTGTDAAEPGATGTAAADPADPADPAADEPVADADAADGSNEANDDNEDDSIDDDNDKDGGPVIVLGSPGLCKLGCVHCIQREGLGQAWERGFGADNRPR